MSQSGLSSQITNQTCFKPPTGCSGSLPVLLGFLPLLPRNAKVFCPSFATRGRTRNGSASQLATVSSVPLLRSYNRADFFWHSNNNKWQVTQKHGMPTNGTTAIRNTGDMSLSKTWPTNLGCAIACELLPSFPYISGLSSPGTGLPCDFEGFAMTIMKPKACLPIFGGSKSTSFYIYSICRPVQLIHSTSSFNYQFHPISKELWPLASKTSHRSPKKVSEISSVQRNTRPWAMAKVQGSRYCLEIYHLLAPKPQGFDGFLIDIISWAQTPKVEFHHPESPPWWLPAVFSTRRNCFGYFSVPEAKYQPVRTRASCAGPEGLRKLCTTMGVKGSVGSKANCNSSEAWWVAHCEVNGFNGCDQDCQAISLGISVRTQKNDRHQF